MRNSTQFKKTGALAALIIGLGLVGASVPAFANSGNKAGPDQSFPANGVVSLGLSPTAPATPPVGGFTAYFNPGNDSSKSCVPVITRHQKTDTIDYPAGC